MPRIPYWLLLLLVLPSTAVAADNAVEGPMDADRYVEIVLRAHPASAQVAGLQEASDAARKSVRLFPDPVVQYSRGNATATEGAAVSGTETGWSVSQTIPWPGTFSAAIRSGDSAAAVFAAEADSVRWDLELTARETFARLDAARSFLGIARAAEQDARSLSELVARRAQLGESRESDRIKATVEWLKQQRDLTAAERAAESAEAILRTLAVEELPRPLLLGETPHRKLAALDRDALLEQMVTRNPLVRAASAEAARQKALLSVARRGRMPDFGLTGFQTDEIDKEASGIALGVKIPLWNANRGEIARTGAALHLADAEVARTRISLSAALEGKLTQLRVAAEQDALLDSDLVPAATRSVELVRFSYQEGETSLLDLLDAQRTYRDTLREAVEAHLGLRLAVAEVQRLIGPEFTPWEGGL